MTQTIHNLEMAKNKAYFEQITIPSGQSFLWRMDDYPWRRCVWNYHPEIEIHLIRHSSGLAYVGDHIGHFEQGQLVLVGSNLPHNWITPLIGDTKLVERDIVVQFDPARMIQLSQTFPELSGIENLFARAARGIEFSGDEALHGAKLLEQMGTVKGLAQLSLLFELFDVMMNADNTRTLASIEFMSQRRIGSKNELAQLEKALSYIQTHYLDSPSLSDVARVVDMSDSNFSRFFKGHTGNTFSDHLSTLRLWTAKRLLSETATPITDVCYDSGFRNISNFNRTFLAATGMKPSVYRQASKSRSIPELGAPKHAFADVLRA